MRLFSLELVDEIIDSKVKAVKEGEAVAIGGLSRKYSCQISQFS